MFKNQSWKLYLNVNYFYEMSIVYWVHQTQNDKVLKNWEHHFVITIYLVPYQNTICIVITYFKRFIAFFEAVWLKKTLPIPDRYIKTTT